MSSEQDRELLELAAKAAGIGPLDFDYAGREKHPYFGPRLPMPQGVVMAAIHRYWNPLADDGDAFRLAVKLMMEVRTLKCSAYAEPFDGCDGRFHESNEDAAAATRRAITRAASALAKGEGKV